jgi:hypothetical protein
VSRVRVCSVLLLAAIPTGLATGSAAAVQPAAVSAAAASTTQATSGPPSFGSDSTYCTLDDDRIDESSGLAVSSWDPSRVWTHNDSGDTARIFALAPPRDGRCATAAVLNLRRVDAFDAEDLAPGPNHTLWLGDIGDNVGQRTSIVLDRVDEPSRVSGEMSVDAQRFRFSYPDVAHDAEALLISPRTGQVVVVTKGTTSHPRIYSASGRPAAGTGPAPAGTQKLIDGGLLDAPGSGGFFEAVTGGAVSPDGCVVVLRTYLDAYVYPVPGDDLVAALQATPRQIHLPSQPQGESVAFASDGASILLSSEGTGTAVLRLQRESGENSAVGRLVGGDRRVRPLLVGVGVAVVLGVVLVIARRRRRRFS